MSKFVTRIPHALSETLAKLPKGATIDFIRVLPDNHGVEITWAHDGLSTNYHYPTVFPECNLGGGSLPQGVSLKYPPAPTPPEPVVTPPQESAPLTLKVDKSTPKAVKKKQ